MPVWQGLVVSILIGLGCLGTGCDFVRTGIGSEQDASAVHSALSKRFPNQSFEVSAHYVLAGNTSSTLIVTYKGDASLTDPDRAVIATFVCSTLDSRHSSYDAVEVMEMHSPKIAGAVPLPITESRGVSDSCPRWRIRGTGIE
jgi:hypothetical protein